MNPLTLSLFTAACALIVGAIVRRMWTQMTEAQDQAERLGDELDTVYERWGSEAEDNARLRAVLNEQRRAGVN